MATKEELIEKLLAGGKITVEDLKSLAPRKREPGSRPSKVCSPKHAVAKAKKGESLSKWELEDLSKSPAHAVAYARIIGGRFPECERQLFLEGSDEDIKMYFLDVVKEKDENFERWLLKSESGPESIVQYCMHILKSRWDEGEDAILKIEDNWNNGIDADYALMYQKEFIRGAWDKLEKVLLNRKKEVANRGAAINTYFEQCGRGRNEDTERRLLKMGNAYAISMYARHCVGGKLTDGLHNKMILSGRKSSKKYLRWLASRKEMVRNYLASLEDDERAEVVGSIPETIASGR